MTADFADETWRYILVPVYVAAYRYQEKTYQVLVNGQTGAVAGQKPVAWWKIWLVVAALLVPGLALGILGLVQTQAGAGGTWPLVLGFGLVLVAVITGLVLYKQALDAEAA